MQLLQSAHAGGTRQALRMVIRRWFGITAAVLVLAAVLGLAAPTPALATPTGGSITATGGLQRGEWLRLDWTCPAYDADYWVFPNRLEPALLVFTGLGGNSSYWSTNPLMRGGYLGNFHWYSEGYLNNVGSSITYQLWCVDPTKVLSWNQSLPPYSSAHYQAGSAGGTVAPGTDTVPSTPAAAFSYRATGTPNQWRLDGSASTPTDPHVAPEQLIFDWSAPSSSCSPILAVQPSATTCTFPAGAYPTVTLQVRNDIGGLAGSVTHQLTPRIEISQIDLDPDPPTGDFTLRALVFNNSPTTASGAAVTTTFSPPQVVASGAGAVAPASASIASGASQWFDVPGHVTGSGAGSAAVHASATVGGQLFTDDRTRTFTIAGERLGLQLEFPGQTGGLPLDTPVTLRVTVTAPASATADYTALQFGSPAVTVSPTDAGLQLLGGPDPSVPEGGFALAPGASTSFDFQIKATKPGAITVSSTVSGVDPSGSPTGVVLGSVGAVVSPLSATLTNGVVTDEGADMVLTLTNDSDATITDLTYVGDRGLAVRNDLVPVDLRGSADVTTGPTPALPTSLAAGAAVTATFHVHPTSTGVVVLVGRAQGMYAGQQVIGLDVGQLQAGPARLSPEEMREFLITMTAAEQRRLAAASGQLSTIGVNALRNEIAGATAPGGSTGLLGLGDDVALGAAATKGIAKGLKTAFVGAYDFVVATPADYYLNMLSRGGGFRANLEAIATDYVDAGIAAGQSIDSATFGAFSHPFDEYHNLSTALDASAYNTAYDALSADLLDEYGQQEQIDGAMADKVAEFSGQVANELAGQHDMIVKDPYAWADHVGVAVGKFIGDTLLAEGATRFGSKLLDLAAAPTVASEATEAGSALDRLMNGQTLEQIQAGSEVSLQTVEQLGGITQTDSGKIQKVIAAVKERFGLDIEIQARPSNPYSVQYLNSELGAVGKPELFKAKNLNDLDVVLGADPAARGKLGVFNPIKPTDEFLAAHNVPPDVRTDLLNRYETQKGVWDDWNNEKSKFSKNFKLASKKGGHTFQFDVPSATGDVNPNKPRLYHLEADHTAPSNIGETITFFERTTGKPIVSDVDFHAYFKTDGSALPAGQRGQVELFLQEQWKAQGIAFGDHGATLNGFDWPGAGEGQAAIARHKFALEYMSKADALAKAEELAPLLGTTVEELLAGYIPGKYVIHYTSGSVWVGPGTVF